MKPSIGEQPAFPCVVNGVEFPGMTYRQWLVGMALAGMQLEVKSPGEAVDNAHVVTEWLILTQEHESENNT